MTDDELEQDMIKLAQRLAKTSDFAVNKVVEVQIEDGVAYLLNAAGDTLGMMPEKAYREMVAEQLAP